MALTPAFRAAGTVSATANNVAASTNLAPGLPTRSTGDTLLLVTVSRSNSASCATPSGWTLLTGFPIRSTTASGGTVYAFTRPVDGSESAPTAAWTSLTTGTNGDSAQAVILSYQNVKLPVALDGAATKGTDAAVTTGGITLPAITTTGANALEIGVALRVNDTAHTFTNGFTNERVDVHTTTGTGHGLHVTDVVRASSGTQATASVTPSLTTSSRALGVAFGLKAADDHQANPGDTLTLADSLVSAERGSEVVADDVLVLDDIHAFDQGKGVGDVLSLSDSAASASEVQKAVDDTADLADSLASIRGIEQVLDDALTSLSDSVLAERGSAVIVDDSAALDDSVALQRGFALAVDDSVSVSDAVALARDIAQAEDDTVSLADSTSLARDVVQQLDDALVLSDVLSRGIGAEVTDVLVLADAAAQEGSWAREVADSLNLTDNVSPVIGDGGAAYVHHRFPLDGDYARDSGGVVVAVVGDGVVAVYDAGGLVAVATNEIDAQASTGGDVESSDTGLIGGV
jgi:hypothetical protein